MECGQVYAAVFSILEGVTLDERTKALLARHMGRCLEDVRAAVADWVGTREGLSPPEREEALQGVADSVGRELGVAGLGIRVRRPDGGNGTVALSLSAEEYGALIDALSEAAETSAQPEIRGAADELLERLLVEGGHIESPEELRRFREERRARRG